MYRAVLAKTAGYVNRRPGRGRFSRFVRTIKMVANKEVRLPLWALVLLIAACVYILSPIDLLPDIIPFVGLLDDALLALAALNTVKPFIKECERRF